jgi:PKD repeat protein
MMKSILNKILFTLLLISSITFTKAQNEYSKWYFGQLAGLDFTSAPPTLLINGAMISTEGCASISDANGNILFYTNGATIYNSMHTAMANGSGLLGHNSSTQAALIVKQPGNNTIYYVFTTDQLGGAFGACYNIVDMSLAAGLGSVTVKNATLYTPTCEKQVAVRHCNGKDIWVVSHEFNSNNFISYQLTSAGLNPNPITSNIGDIITGVAGASTVGQMKISPNGKKLGTATYTSSANGTGGYHLYDFDAATGIVSNSLTLLNDVSAYGLEFSPDGTKLYGVKGANNSVIYQWNICVPSNSAIVASQYSFSVNTFMRATQLGIDGKIYVASSSSSIHLINNPNASGAGMNFLLNNLNITPKICQQGFPNNINPYTKPAPLPFSNTVSCNNVSFAAVLPTFSSGCTSTPYPPGGYLWDFGEPASGTANNSNLNNPTHLYANTGTYTVSLILFNPCTNDTVKKVIIINTLGPKPNVAGTFTICKGDKYTYTASGGSTYNWSNNSTAATVALNPTQTTVYSVSSSSNGCTLSKSFTVTVNACLGIGDVASSASATGEVSGIRIYPNPIKDILFIEAATQTQLYIFDITGKQVLEAKLNAGQNKLNAENLPAGVYSLKTIGVIGNWHGRVVKME